MSYCTACGVKEGHGATLYCFPSDPLLRQKWLTFCKLEEHQLKKYANKLCEKHFSDEYLYPKKDNGLRWKRKNAIPTINIPSTVHISNSTKSRGVRSRVKHRRCCLPSCRSTGSTVGVSFFKFPCKCDIFDKWVKFCNIPSDSILPSYTLCSLHFSPTDIIDNTATGGKRMPVKNAVPTIRNPLREKNTTPPLTFVMVQPESPSAALNGHPSLDVSEVMSLQDPIAPSSSDPIAVCTTSTKCDSLDADTGFKLPRYVGMIRISHLSTPSRASACLALIKRQIFQKNKYIRVQRRKISRLQERLKTVNALLRHLQRKHLISEKSHLVKKNS